jgi:23S rRNA (cytidine1920-2'-O)/16S rRNA (cytidine1409-2'-O)-methyltransferase
MSQKLRPERERLDRVLVSRGLVASREDAARLILAGLVRVDGVVVDKAAKPTLSDAKVELTGPGSP